MTAPVLYYLPESGPCRTVLLTASVLGIKLDTKYVDLFKLEQLSPEYLNINPMHTVPTLSDGDLNLIESRAIMTYLVEKYGQDDSLYPKDPKRRAIINQKLQFDIGSLYKPINECYTVIYRGSKTHDESKIPSIKLAFEILDSYLASSLYTAGDCLTVADIALVSSVATVIAVLDFDLSVYTNVQRWYNNLKNTLPDFKQIVEDNGRKLRILVDSFRK